MIEVHVRTKHFGWLYGRGYYIDMNPSLADNVLLEVFRL